MDQSGTILDVEYTGDYFWHQSPALMNYIAVINGYSPRNLAVEFSYCELGCGKGVTSIVLASTHSRARFFACDLNPAHIRGARGMAESGEVRNVTFFERGFEEMGRESLPAFDFITLHGVWSWVSDEVRNEICAFIEKKLKSGGLVMLSYNAMPGWAHIEPIRRMMHAYANNLVGSSIEKAHQAYGYVRFLADNKAGYFVTNPAAVQHLESVAAADQRYVVHEYMTPHSDPFYFSDVADSMRRIGLAFAGSMAPIQNYPAQSVPAQFRSLMSTARNRMVLETHRDFISNMRFRYDLYAAQPEISTPEPTIAPQLDQLFFRLKGSPEQLPLRGEHEGATFDFGQYAGAVRAVHELLTMGAADAATIVRAAGISLESSSRFLQDLVLARHIWPCSPNVNTNVWPRVQDVLIDLALRERQGHAVFVCPKTGAAEYVDLGFALALQSVRNVQRQKQSGSQILARLRENGYSPGKLSPDGKKVPFTDAEALSHCDRLCAAARDPSHPTTAFLRAIGAV